MHVDSTQFNNTLFIPQGMSDRLCFSLIFSVLYIYIYIYMMCVCVRVRVCVCVCVCVCEREAGGLEEGVKETVVVVMGMRDVI